jgi:DNA-binding PadR family transcriptional regulator
MDALTPDETMLGLLAAEARHGYQLIDCFRDPAQLGNVWSLSTSQIYAVLKRLDSQQLIVGQAVESADAPTRVEYRLTPQGVRRLEAWLTEAEPSASVRRVRVEFLSRLYVARLLNIPTRAIVDAQKNTCRQRLEQRSIERDCSAPGVGRLALELEISQLNAILDWIDRCEMRPPDLGAAP